MVLRSCRGTVSRLHDSQVLGEDFPEYEQIFIHFAFKTVKNSLQDHSGMSGTGANVSDARLFMKLACINSRREFHPSSNFERRGMAPFT